MIIRKKSERQFVKAWRLERGLTQAQLGEKAGLTQAQIQQIEGGKRGFSQDGLERIAAALQTTPGALLTGPPSDAAPPEILKLWDQATAHQRQQLLAIAKTLTGNGD